MLGPCSHAHLLCLLGTHSLMGQRASAGLIDVSRQQVLLCSRCHVWGVVQGGLVIVLEAVALI